MTDFKNYEDIIDLEYQKSYKRQWMSTANRAAQFGSFSALAGYDEVISETSRLTQEKIILDEEEKFLLNQTLQELIRILKGENKKSSLVMLNSSIHIKDDIILDNKGYIDSPFVSVVYFIRDDKKAGGFYDKLEGYIVKIDEYNRAISFENGIVIEVEDIIKIDIING